MNEHLITTTCAVVFVLCFAFLVPAVSDGRGIVAGWAVVGMIVSVKACEFFDKVEPH